MDIYRGEPFRLPTPQIERHEIGYVTIPHNPFVATTRLMTQDSDVFVHPTIQEATHYRRRESTGLPLDQERRAYDGAKREKL